MARQPSGLNDVTTTEELHHLLDSLIHKLLRGINDPGKYVDVAREHIEVVCSNVVNKLMDEPMMLELECPIAIVGDVHGQFIDLLRIFDRIGLPSEQKYLCLGDYVDRGPQSVEITTLLLAYKLRYPHNIFLLRGNHECERMCKSYGFEREIIQRYNDPSVLNNFTFVFNHMPIAAIIEKKLFCTHGGISKVLLQPDVTDLRAAVNEIRRPVDVPSIGLMCDLLWSDPMPASNPPPSGWETSPRGCSYRFGYDVMNAFLVKYGIKNIIRAHQYFHDGAKVINNKLVSIFSAPNYMNMFGNRGVAAKLEKYEDGFKTKVEFFDPANIEYAIPFMV
ncbi:Serine/threonine-protein phosphatase PP1-2 [Taenia crassiceps]|uniref:Serine/threonine-protein phosphatase n=1 Tax=Taenia crassiceps TaxID=6207 RepID=A0ABR4QH37_9CEST